MRAATALLAAGLLLGPVTPLGAQSVRVAAWGGYDAVTASDDWSTLGTQVTWTNRRGHALWAAGELISRFGRRDGAERVGVLLRPGQGWWATLEVATAIGPELVPKNAWEADVTRLVARRVAVGLDYQRRNYAVGVVDLVAPHATFPTGALVWDVRLYVSRSPADRTDLAFLARVSRPLSGRISGQVGAGAGRESFLVGVPPAQQVQSLRTVTGLVGLRAVVGRWTTAHVELTAVKSDPVLSRRGISAGLERRF